MMIILALLFPAALAAQSTLTISGPSVVGRGSTFPVAVMLTSSEVSAVQWTATIPEALGFQNAEVGVAATTSGKSLHLNANGLSLVVGENANLVSGVIAEYILTVPPNTPRGVYRIELINPIAANSLGEQVPVAAVALDIRVMAEVTRGRATVTGGARIQ